MTRSMFIKVIGAGAGGGLPQWNCNGQNSVDARHGVPSVKQRTQASVAVSANGRQWVLLNASPDLRQQINATPELHPDRNGPPRNSPIKAVVLTNGDVDAVAGLLCLRESSAADGLWQRARARRAGRQQHFRRAESRARQAQDDGARRILRGGGAVGAGGPYRRGVHRAGQDPALSRGRGEGHRRQLRHRGGRHGRPQSDRRRNRQALLLHSGLLGARRRTARASSGCAAPLLRRHALHE